MLSCSEFLTVLLLTKYPGPVGGLQDCMAEERRWSQGGHRAVLLNSLPWLPFSSDGKESACNAGDPGLITGLGRSSGKGNGNPLQYSCLENPMNRGAWQAIVREVQRVGHNWVTNTTTAPCFSHGSPEPSQQPLGMSLWPWLGTFRLALRSSAHPLLALGISALSSLAAASWGSHRTVCSAALPTCHRAALRLSSPSFTTENRHKPIYFLFSLQPLWSICNLLVNCLLRVSKLRVLTPMLIPAILPFSLLQSSHFLAKRWNRPLPGVVAPSFYIISCVLSIVTL